MHPTYTRTHSFVYFGNDQVPLSRASKRQRSAEHTTVFTLAERGNTPPSIVHTSNRTEYVVIRKCTPGMNILLIFTPHKYNLTRLITFTLNSYKLFGYSVLLKIFC